MKLFGKEGLAAVGIVLSVVFALAFLNFYTNINSSLVEHTLAGSAISTGRLTLFIMITNVSNGSVFFAPGWNFVSFYPQLLNYSIESVLAGASGQYEYILEWNGTSQDFNLWSRNGVKDFDEFNKNKSYFIFFTGTNTSLNLSGARFGDYNITLPQGWEAPLWPYEYDASVSGQVFYNASFDYMLTWNRSDQEFMVYSIQSSTPDFNSILAGDGYFIKTEGGKLVYVRA
jgi:hypothetical protein